MGGGYLNYEEYAYEEELRRGQALRAAVEQARAQRAAEIEAAGDGGNLPAKALEGQVLPAAVRRGQSEPLARLVEDCFTEIARLGAAVKWRKVPTEFRDQTGRLVHELVSGIIAVIQEEQRSVVQRRRLQHDMELAGDIFDQLCHPDTNILQQELLLAEFERARREALAIVGSSPFPPPSMV